MFKTIQASWTKDADLPDRAFRLQMLGRVLDGTLYDALPHAFHEEKAPNDEYIPLRNRRPSSRYRLCRLVVDDSVSLLFSEGHFPDIECGTDEACKEAIRALAKELRFNELMIDAATRGSVGSVAILMRVLINRPFFEVMDTVYLTPTWDANAPDTLAKVTELYKIKGKDLNAAGYKVDDKAMYWFRREWDADAEVWFVPQIDSDQKEGKPPVKDAANTVQHGLGFVPMVWIRNLPGGDKIDGACTFPNECIDTNIEIDYQLSQGGRALKYAGDPTLMIKEPAGGDNGSLVKGGGNAIVVAENGDAKMLEINGTATEAVINFVRLLRELTIESMHGNRAQGEKQTAPSGRALELLNQQLIWLADKLRISYGEIGMVSLLTMLIKAHQKFPLKMKTGAKLPEIPANTEITLRWPAWYTPSMQDMLDRANTLRTLCDSALLSRETAIKVLAAEYDIEDAKAELMLATADMEARNAAAQVQAKINE